MPITPPWRRSLPHEGRALRRPPPGAAPVERSAGGRARPAACGRVRRNAPHPWPNRPGAGQVAARHSRRRPGGHRPVLSGGERGGRQRPGHPFRPRADRAASGRRHRHRRPCARRPGRDPGPAAAGNRPGQQQPQPRTAHRPHGHGPGRQGASGRGKPGPAAAAHRLPRRPGRAGGPGRTGRLPRRARWSTRAALPQPRHSCSRRAATWPRCRRASRGWRPICACTSRRPPLPASLPPSS